MRKQARNSQAVFEDSGNQNIQNVRGTIPSVDNRGIHNMVTYNPFAPPERVDERRGYNGFSLGDTGRDLRRETVMDIIRDNPGRRNIWQ